jgi:hypothetical protein
VGVFEKLFPKNATAASRLAEEIELLHNSPLLDAVWYRQTYVDVRDTPIDVARHYVEHGAGEGRDPGPLFDTKFYLRRYPDVRASGKNALVHFLRTGAGEGRVPHPQAAAEWYRKQVARVGLEGVFSRVLREAESSVDEAVAPADRERQASEVQRVLDCHYEVWRVPGSLEGRLVCLFAVYSHDGYVSNSTLWLVRALRAAGLLVICIVASRNSGIPYGDEEIECEGLVSRDNDGYDFASWALGLQILPSIWLAKVIVFANDSIFGPLSQRRLDAVLRRIEASPSDYIALTQSWQVAHHFQSYFFALKERALRHPDVRRFWATLQCVKTREQAILGYEIPMLDMMTRFQLGCEALFPLNDRDFEKDVNPTLDHWRALIDGGFPFIKVQTLRDDITGVDKRGWQSNPAIDPKLLPLMLERLEGTRERSRKSRIARAGR